MTNVWCTLKIMAFLSLAKLNEFSLKRFMLTPHGKKTNEQTHMSTATAAHPDDLH